MGMTKVVEIDGKKVPFKASAAIPRMYLEIPAKQHIRPGGTACCSASNGMLPGSL